MSIAFSDKLRTLPPAIFNRIFRLQAEIDRPILSLAIGEPDFVTPRPIIQAGIESLERGETHYPPPGGLPALREAISDYIFDRYGVRYEPLSQILVTIGVSEAMDLMLRILLNPEDGVLYPEPAFTSYETCIRMAGGLPQPIPMERENGYRLTPEALEAHIRPNSKVLLLTYPNNPTGAVMRQEDWDALVPVLRRHPNLVIMTDELYFDLCFSDEPPASLIRCEELRARTIFLSGFSKAFAMTGWRLGYLCAPPEVIAASASVHLASVMNASATAQFAGVEALRNGEADREEMRRIYKARRDWLVPALRNIGLPVAEPGGAFYAFPNIEVTGLDSITFCERLLSEESVLTMPGIAFGAAGEGHVRLSFAASQEVLEEAVRRMGAFVARCIAEKQAQ